MNTTNQSEGFALYTPPVLNQATEADLSEAVKKAFAPDLSAFTPTGKMDLHLNNSSEYIVFPSELLLLHRANIISCPYSLYNTIELPAYLLDDAIPSIHPPRGLNTSLPNYQEPIEIPIELESTETLEYLGFHSHRANELYQRFATYSGCRRTPKTLIRFVTTHLSQLKTQSLFQNMLPTQILDRIGIDRKFWAQLRCPLLGADGIHYWLTVMMKERWKVLERAIKRLKIAAEVLKMRKEDEMAREEGVEDGQDSEEPSRKRRKL
jgi:hypothetical protein